MRAGWVLFGLALIWGWFLAGESRGADPPGGSSANRIEILEKEGTVEVLRAGATAWDKASLEASYKMLGPGDQLRTGENSRAAVRLSNGTVTRLDQKSLLRIPEQKKEGTFFEFVRGIMYFFHRDKPGELDVNTPRVSAVIRGTEFNLKVSEEDGTTTLTMFEGEVVMTNGFGRLDLSSGQEAIVRPNERPMPTAAIFSVNTVQWCLYYPGVLYPPELRLEAAEQEALGDSLAAYGQGNLPLALQRYPANRAQPSLAEKLYRAGLLLSVGNVAETESILAAVGLPGPEQAHLSRIAESLRQLIAAVRFQPYVRSQAPELASEWMAQSYYLQSQSRLEEALEAARRARELAPDFGFAWSRAAELEFGFGRSGQAAEWIERSLELSPGNAQALSLKGFVLAAQNRIDEARIEFEKAMAADGALGNAWLGRGLTHIRQGRVRQGREDIQVAATLEPQRSMIRSYLGKAYQEDWDEVRALKELELAIRLDAKDPTPWMYSALVHKQQNRINQAVDDLERAAALNENRGLYRSRLLLDQDLAVRRANLASVYADAGMNEQSLREASRSVNADYANFSGHLFLANSYSRLQDPGRITLRYETPAVSEYLLANLLAPVGAGTLSPVISQQEYSKLLESDGMGVVGIGEYLSRGAVNASVTGYGTYDNSAFSLNGSYLYDNGERRNYDLRLWSLSLTWKEQVSPQDSVFTQLLWSESKSGDVSPRYDPNVVNTKVLVKERQQPIALAGYHHEWTPGSHTLFLASRLNDTLIVHDPFQGTALIQRNLAGAVAAVVPDSMAQSYSSELEIYSWEAQQILQRNDHTFIAGTRYQTGEFNNRNRHALNPNSFFIGQTPPVNYTHLVESSDAHFESASLYFYHQWQVADPLLLVGGVSYDWIEYPANFRFAPISDDEETAHQLSPKAGLVWTPGRTTTVQGAYTRALNGASFEQSVSLEPSQVGGLNQAFRSVIPDAVAGSSIAEAYDQFAVAVNQKLATRTYVDIVGQYLKSDVDRDFGVYDVLPFNPLTSTIDVIPSSTRQSLNYHEKSVGLTVNQLVGEDWSFGASYQFSVADLNVHFKEVPASAIPLAGFRRKLDFESYLHHVKLFGIYNHPSGFFAEGQSLWFQQSNQDYPQDMPGDDFWQFNIFAGYRFLQRRAEVTVGLLNVTDQDYRLAPLNLTPNLARDRTFVARLRFNF